MLPADAGTQLILPNLIERMISRVSFGKKTHTRIQISVEPGTRLGTL